MSFFAVLPVICDVTPAGTKENALNALYCIKNPTRLQQ